MPSSCTLRPLQASDIPLIAAAFAELGWNKPAAQYERYLVEQQNGTREVLTAWQNNRFAGYLTIVWQSDYPPFRDARIPEIRDFNVLPDFRRQGIGTALMNEAESRILERSTIIGIGVGMTQDYGAAQRMYAQRGYVPDGRGLMYQEKPITYGVPVMVDDDLVLFFTKTQKD